MNNTLINDTNAKLNGIIEGIKDKRDEYEEKLAETKNQIDNELAKVNDYKTQFNDAKKKIQKMTDDINGFETDYNNLVEKFKDDDLANILSGVSKEIDAKIKEKKRNIQKDQEEMNNLVDKAEQAKNELVHLTNEKKALETVLKQINDVYKYYDEEFERIVTYTQENVNDLHPYDEEEEETEEEINIDDIEISNDNIIVHVPLIEDFENDDEKLDINVSIEDDSEEEEVEDEEYKDESDDEEFDDEEDSDEDEESEDDEEYEESEDDEEYDESDEEIDDEEDSENEEEEELEETEDDEEPSIEDIASSIDKIVINDDLEDDDEDSIQAFLNKDENDIF